MNITIAIVFVDSTAMARIDSEYLIRCAVEGNDGGADIDYNRRALEQAFSEVYSSEHVEVMFPELGECIDDNIDAI